MRRPALPKKVRTEVALKSRRICCICYGLKIDSERKKGQFAHLDHNPRNNKVDNIAFLCFDHHDEYDSKTSQAASISEGEVRHYRDDLYKFIERREKTFETQKRQVLGAVEYWMYRKGPTKAEIDDALKFYAGTHRSRAGMMLLDDGPKTLPELLKAIPGEKSWVTSIIDDLAAVGWAYKPTEIGGTYRISPVGERLMRILDAIPDFIKQAAWEENWMAEKFGPKK